MGEKHSIDKVILSWDCPKCGTRYQGTLRGFVECGPIKCHKCDVKRNSDGTYSGGIKCVMCDEVQTCSLVEAEY